MANTRANQNRKIRQDALREQLEQQGHVQHVVDITKKLMELSNDLDSLKVQRLKAAADIKMKLIAKYIPDLRSIEHTGSIEVTDERSVTDEELLNIATSSSTRATQQANSKKEIH